VTKLKTISTESNIQSNNDTIVK